MLLKDAKVIARQWVMEQASDQPGFIGAFMSGSTNWTNDDTLLTSDIDLKVVLEVDAPPLPPNLLLYHDVLLDINSISSENLGTADTILGTYYLAGHFVRSSILSDPTGLLKRLHTEISVAFAQRRWVRARLEQAVVLAESTPTWVDDTQPFDARVVFWWLGSLMYGLHSLHVADLRNPTFSRNLIVSREILAKYGRQPLFDNVLETIGIRHMSQAQATDVLQTFALAFDTAAQVLKTPFILSWSINPSSRGFMVDRYLDRVKTDDYREIMFQPLIYLSLCQRAIQNDAPEAVKPQFEADYRRVLEQLGVGSEDDLRRRKAQTSELLVSIRQAAEAIVEANPATTD